MNDLVKERISVFNQMNSNIKWESINKKNQKYSLNILILLFALIYCSVFLCLAISIMSCFGIVFKHNSWESSSLIITITFGILVLSHSSILEIIAKKHILKILEKDIYFDSEINNELKRIIRKLPPKGIDKFYSIFASIMILGSILQELDLNPLWEYFDVLSVVFIIYSIIYLVKNASLLIKNNNKILT